MTDRGLPSIAGAPACPFVAFEDDREERATSPDHRHRCYAETRPAPRALAHQEAYCLSSAFPVCPTFQDWARREAAQERAMGPGSAQPGPPDPAIRNPPRDWTAPPPWTGGPLDAAGPGTPSGLGSQAGSGNSAAINVDDAEGDEPDLLAGRSQPGMGLAGSAAERLAMGRAAYPEPRVGTSVGAAADGHAASSPTPASAPDDPFGDFDPAYDEREQPSERPERAGGLGGLLGRDKRPRVGDSRRGRPVPPDAAPVWERPRRYEAYPTIKTRVGMPSLSRVALMALALLLAAVAVFLLPGLLGLGGPSGPVGGRPSTAPSAGPSASVEPATPAAPTPMTYTVAPKDTLEKIARKYGVTVAEILAVNPQITNPNKIAIGDVIVIPKAGASASPSTAP
jgi:nucleoid-associated protein YgaU